MRHAVILGAVMLPALLSGCVTSHPQTAEEFRQAVPGAYMAKVETMEVNRPYEDVSRTIEEKAPECLNVSIRTVSQSMTSYQVIVTEYRPTVRVTDRRTELHVQQHHKQGVLKITKEPAGGYYLLVADATPVTGGRTRLDVYGPSIGHDTLIRAVKGWATGENVGCPDLTK